jgi:hypothetical protein
MFSAFDFVSLDGVLFKVGTLNPFVGLAVESFSPTSFHATPEALNTFALKINSIGFSELELKVWNV